MNVESFPIFRFSGAGNTFCIINERDLDKSFLIDKPKIALKICAQDFGLGTDGLVFLSKNLINDEFDYEWDFYNSDGSSAEMCGNAARCVGAFCQGLLGEKKNEMTLKTKVGNLRILFRGNNQFSVVMGNIPLAKMNVAHHFQEKEITFDYINSGVPHLVKQLADRQSFSEVLELAQSARRNRNFHPQGCNVTFIKEPIQIEKEMEYIEAITFERGLENYSRACGTGAIAAAWKIATSTEKSKKEVNVKMPGGLLNVNFENSKTTLTGEAIFIAKAFLAKGII